MDGSGIRFAVASEPEIRAANGQHWRSRRTSLISLNQAGEQRLKGIPVLLWRHNVAPRLFVVRFNCVICFAMEDQPGFHFQPENLFASVVTLCLMSPIVVL